MKNLMSIEGAFGGGGQQQYVPIETNDTLSSKHTIRLLFAISEGEIDSVPNILLNKVPITDATYAGKVSYDFRTGTSNQTMIPGFSDVEAPISGAGSFPISLTAPSGVGVDHVYNFPATTSAVRLTLILGMLKQQKSNGDRVAYTVQYSISKRIVSGGIAGSWTTTTYNKSGKCTSPYSWDMRVERPANMLSTDTWDINVKRVTTDDATPTGTTATYSPLSLQGITTIQDSPLTYPGTALVAITISDSSVFGNQVPNVRFYPKGIKFFLPNGYTPPSRNSTTKVWTGATYPATWDTFFKSTKEYTNNLAWVIYYCLVDSNWGIGIPATDIDVGSFYNFSKYCDEMISDGAGGTMPRYVIDIQFLERDTVPSFFMYLLSLGNANFSNNDYGQIKIVWDAPGQAITKIVSNANVIDGLFNYSSNAIDTKVNLANVTFTDETIFGDTNTATFSDSTLISRYGLQTSDIVLPGCVSQARALYKAKWAIWANSYDTDIITFQKSFEGANYRIGELVSVMDTDNFYNGNGNGHAVIVSSAISGTTTNITLDRSILLLNESYTVLFILADGTVSQQAISQINGSFTVVTVPTAVTAFVGATILFSATTVKPRTYKVIKIEKQDAIYTITACVHSESKYASYINTSASLNILNSTSTFNNIAATFPPAVTSLSVTPTYVNGSNGNFAHLNVNWVWDAAFTQKYKANYVVGYSKDGAGYTLTTVQNPNFDIVNVVPGIYTIKVWSVNPVSNLYSSEASFTYNHAVASGTSTLNAPSAASFTFPAVNATTLPQPSLICNWTNPSTNYAAGTSVVDRLQYFSLEIKNTALTTLYKTYLVPASADFTSGTFILSYTENVQLFGTFTRAFKVLIYCVDLVGNKSAATTLTIV